MAGVIPLTFAAADEVGADIAEGFRLPRPAASGMQSASIAPMALMSSGTRKGSSPSCPPSALMEQNWQLKNGEFLVHKVTFTGAKMRQQTKS